MPNFRSLARLEVPEKFVWWVVFAKSFSCLTQPLCCVEVRVGVLTILFWSRGGGWLGGKIIPRKLR